MLGIDKEEGAVEPCPQEILKGAIEAPCRPRDVLPPHVPISGDLLNLRHYGYLHRPPTATTNNFTQAIPSEGPDKDHTA